MVAEVNVASAQNPTIIFPSNNQPVAAGSFGAYGTGPSTELYYHIIVRMPNRPNGGTTIEERRNQVTPAGFMWTMTPPQTFPTDPGVGATWELELMIYDPVTRIFGAPFQARSGAYGP